MNVNSISQFKVTPIQALSLKDEPTGSIGLKEAPSSECSGTDCMSVYNKAGINFRASTSNMSEALRHFKKGLVENEISKKAADACEESIRKFRANSSDGMIPKEIVQKVLSTSMILSHNETMPAKTVNVVRREIALLDKNSYKVIGNYTVDFNPRNGKIISKILKINNIV